MKTMKTYKLLLFSLATLLFVSCEKEMDKSLADVSVSVSVNEQVRYEGNIVTVRKGTPVQFLLNGEPDFVSFFSGEIGHQYIYRDRIEISPDNIESCDLKFSVYAMNGNSNSCKDMLDIFYQYEGQDPENAEKTINFPGMSKTNFEADSLLVGQTAQWKTFIARSELPTVIGTGGTKTFSKSLKEYIDKKMTLAIAYNKDGHQTGDPGYPAYSDGTPIPQTGYMFQNMRIETLWKNGRTTTSYASSFMFTPLNMNNKSVYVDQLADNMPQDAAYGSVKTGVPGMWNLATIMNGTFSINGTGDVKSKWKYSWLVSDYLNLTECSGPDTGVNVKDISLEVSSYTHTYNKVGTYRATFLMNNANYANTSSKICELVINVTE